MHSVVRMWRPAAAILAVTAIVISTISLVGLGPASADTGVPHLPRHVYTPWGWQARQQQAPIGSASLVMFGNTMAFANYSTTEPLDPVLGAAALVGAQSGSYRIVPWEADGRLSPDGTRLAYYWDDSPDAAKHATARVMDLRTSAVTTYELPGGRGATLAWSPDGRRLEVSDGGTLRGSAAPPQAYVVDLATHAVTATSLPGEGYSDFSPDGKTIAEGWDRKIYLAPSAGGQRRILPLAENEEFGGVWTPDGRSLAVASYDPCPSCAPESPRRTWRMHFVDAATGKPVPGMSYGPFADLGAIRGAGWRDSRLVVMALYAGDLPDYDPKWHSGSAKPGSADTIAVNGIDLLSVETSGAPDVLLSTPADIGGLQVSAYAVKAGRSVSGNYPDSWLIAPWAAIVLLIVAVPILLVIGLISGVRRRRS